MKRVLCVHCQWQQSLQSGIAIVVGRAVCEENFAVSSLATRKGTNESLPFCSPARTVQDPVRAQQGSDSVFRVCRLFLPCRLASQLAFDTTRSSVPCKHHRNTAPPSEPGLARPEACVCMCQCPRALPAPSRKKSPRLGKYTLLPALNLETDRFGGSLIAWRTKAQRGAPLKKHQCTGIDRSGVVQLLLRPQQEHTGQRFLRNAVKHQGDFSIPVAPAVKLLLSL